LLLQLGDVFNMPNTNCKFITVEYIKCLEDKFEKINKIDRINYRNKSVKILESLEQSIKFDNIDNLLHNWLKITKSFMRNNQDILFTKADKSNTTVAIDKNQYNGKMNNILDDNSTYLVVEKDPTKNITDKLKQVLTSWKNKGYIENNVYRSLLVTDGVLPRAYGMPKIHKKGIPCRIVVSSINSPLHKLAVYIHKIIKNNINNPNSYVKDSYDLVNKLKNTQLHSKVKIASFDVVSLFTNVPLDFAMDSIRIRWAEISVGTSISCDDFLNRVSLILNSTFFKFNNKIYKQIFDTPMGSPLSPIIAQIVLRDIEERVFNVIPFHIPIYYRYVDDILIATPLEEMYNALCVFNSIHDRVQFTSEINDDNYINFLNLKVAINDNNRIVIDLYSKPTASGRFLNFYSNNPITHKKGIIYGMIDKVLLLSDTHFHNDNIKSCIEHLLNNSYSLKFIFNTIRNRIKYHIYKQNNNKENKEDNDIDYTKTCAILYVKEFSNRIASLLSNSGVKTTYKCNNKLNNIIKPNKDPLPYMQNSNVVYKITCSDCQASYIGQTKRQLGTRIKEHKQKINNKKTDSLAVITEHIFNTNHKIDWDNTKILDRETNYNKRLISECIHIKRHAHNINKKTDTDLFPDNYLPILYKIKN